METSLSKISFNIKGLESVVNSSGGREERSEI